MKQVKKVFVQLDKKRQLHLDFNAMVAFEDETGTSLFEMKDTDSMSAKTIRALLWACLLHEDESLDIKDVGKFVTLSNIQEISEKLGEAMAIAYGQKGNGQSLELVTEKN